MRGIWDRVKHHLCKMIFILLRGLSALHSSKPVPLCTAVRVVGGELLTQESEVKACKAGYFEQLYQGDPPAAELNVRGPCCYYPDCCPSNQL